VRIYNQMSPIAESLEMLNAKLDRGADPALLTSDGDTVLNWNAHYVRCDKIGKVTEHSIGPALIWPMMQDLPPSSTSSSKLVPTRQYPVR